MQLFLIVVAAKALDERLQNLGSTSVELANHPDESCFDGFVLDELHGAVLDACQVRVADPGNVVWIVVGASFEGCTALSADDFAGKAVAVLVLVAFGIQALLDSSAGHGIGSFLKILVADDCSMMVLAEVHVFFAVVPVAIEVLIRVGLLEDNIPGVLLILQDTLNG